jgi:hypothetical protein
MLKWIGCPAIGFLAMFPTASGAQAIASNALSFCGISAATVTKVQNQLAAVINLSDGNGGLFLSEPDVVCGR